MRNPKSNPQNRTEKQAERTREVIQTYRGKCDLLRQWELQPDSVQADNHEYILALRATVRKFKNYLDHRSYDPKI